jgi:hypothetical protein
VTPHRVGDAPSIGGAWRRKVARQQAKHMCGTAPRSNLTRISTSRRRRRAPAVCEPLISHPQRSPNGYVRGPETQSRCVFRAGRATDVPAGTRSGTGAASSTVSCQSRRRAQHCQKLIHSLATRSRAGQSASAGRRLVKPSRCRAVQAASTPETTVGLCKRPPSTASTRSSKDAHTVSM